MFIYLFFLFIVTQRALELYIARKNAIYIQSIGGIEIGRNHYPIIVLLHILFLVSFFIEGLDSALPSFWPIPLFIFFLAQIFRFWILYSLGRYWNTRIFVVPHSKPIKKGPYKYIRHPNYLIVMLEMIVIPLIFGSYMTAVIFSILNFFILRLRIHLEEKALESITSYDDDMKEIPRFFPKYNK